ncbi:MAG: hypothetical protein R3212_00040 [Xanthomonadales bacterium]|nr:hypothetical protein [Xanthomonadales bacterium]
MLKANGPVTDSDGDAKPIDTLSIDRQFCGPPDSANGGYACGRLAHYIEGPATVRLMKPPPLDRPLDVVRMDGQVELRDDGVTIARAWPGGPEISVPPAPELGSARLRRAFYVGLDEGIFPTCFVCGAGREEGDGLRIHAGPDREADRSGRHVACTWTPHPAFCGADGAVPSSIAWAALDCPSGWAFLSDGDEVALLGEYSAHIDTPLRCGIEYIVAGWEVAREGRKRLTGSAIYDRDGNPLAWARATWIVIRDH